jgi:molybdenum cofactor guanylyltransferase
MGTDKNQLVLGSETMLQRTVRLLSHVVEPTNILAVAAVGQEVLDLPESITVLRDTSADRGPLEGIATGFRALEAKGYSAAYVTGCDTPFINSNIVDYLFEKLFSSQSQVVVPADDYQLYPLNAAYRTSTLFAVEEQLAADRLSLHDLIEQIDALKVGLEEFRIFDPELKSLWNLNRWEDYQRALNEIG